MCLWWIIIEVGGGEDLEDKNNEALLRESLPNARHEMKRPSASNV